MFHFAVIAMPAVAPMASHQRGSPLVSSRVTSHSRTVQHRKSGVVVVSSCIAPRYSAQQAVAIAASSWPRGPAPSCRAIDPVSTTIAAKHERGQRAQPDERVPGEQRVQVREQRGEQRLVHVAERGVRARRTGSTARRGRTRTWR